MDNLPFYSKKKMAILDFIKKVGQQIIAPAPKTINGHPVVYNVAPISAPIGALGGAATAVASAAAKVGQVAIANPIKAVVATAGTIVGYNALKSSPKAATVAAETVTKAPSRLANVGTNLGELIENPSYENVKKLFVENPIIVGGTAALAAGSAAVALGGIASNIQNTRAVKENTEATLNSPSGVSYDAPKGSVQASPEKVMYTEGTKPSGSQTQDITRKRRNRKPKVKEISPSMRQSMQIFINNRNSANRTTKNYINERLYN